MGALSPARRRPAGRPDPDGAFRPRGAAARPGVGPELDQLQAATVAPRDRSRGHRARRVGRAGAGAPRPALDLARRAARRHAEAGRLHRRRHERHAGLSDLRRRADARPQGPAASRPHGRHPGGDRHGAVHRRGGGRLLGRGAARRAPAVLRLGAGVRGADQPDRPGRGGVDAEARADPRRDRGRDAGRGAVQRRRRHRDLHGAARFRVGRRKARRSTTTRRRYSSRWASSPAPTRWRRPWGPAGRSPWWRRGC